MYKIYEIRVINYHQFRWQNKWNCIIFYRYLQKKKILSTDYDYYDLTIYIYIYIRLYAWDLNRVYKIRYIYIILIFQPHEMNNLQVTAENKTREGWRNIKLYFKVEMGWWFRTLNLDYNSRIICTFSIADKNSKYQIIETILSYHNVLWRFFLPYRSIYNN